MPEARCPSCGHGRTQHSKDGCTMSAQVNGKWVECPCKVKYMEIR